jgi:putative peptide zinc metalloprotease protein
VGAAPERAPERASGLLLIGEMAGSGYREPPALVRRTDGQTLQLTPLLYAVLEAVDGRRDDEQIADLVRERTGRPVSPADVRALVDDKLRPLGLLTTPDGREPELKRSNPLLGLRFRYVVTDPDRTRRLTAPFARLFHPVLVAAVLAAFAAVCWWIFAEKGLASATYQAFRQPGLLLLVLGVTVLSAGFHEFGHAAAARYGGATPGVMGAGVYLVWPAFYTDVTDSYRLGRAGRVRTDLGGLYFNAIVAVAVTGLWWAIGYDALLLVVATQILQMIRQLTPLVRFDGYHLLADLTGVPDLFHRIGPTLTGLLPWRWGEPAARVLKPWARAVVTLWVLVVVPVLLATLALMVLALPRVLGTAWASLVEDARFLDAAWTDGDLLGAAARVLAMVAVSFPLLAGALVLARMVRRLIRSVWRRTAGRPVRRTVAAVLAGTLAAGLAWAWWPGQGTYRPIRPNERGTLVEAVSALPGVPARPALVEGRQGTLLTAWDTSDPLPTEDRPQLAVVLVPRDPGNAGDPQGWVFPFDKPLAPDAGDNQALAVNTTDGTVVYDTAFALVWVEDGADARNVNEAYAFASCRGCAAVAVAFQVVLVVGENHLAAPQNLSGALNHDCVNCLTYALAKQLFVTLDRPLSQAARSELDAVWAQIAAFGRSLRRVPLAEVAARLDDFERQILDVLERDGAVSGTVEPATTPGGTPSGAPSASPEATPSATTSSSGSAEASPTGTPSDGSPAPSQSPSPSEPGASTPIVSPSPSTG